MTYDTYGAPSTDARELGWDDEIVESSGFELLPEGEYDFEVINLERARHNGSTKLPPCPKAIVTLRVNIPDGLPVQVTNNFFLYSSCQGLNFDFFASIGLAQRGEPFRMRWDEIIGRTGRAKIMPRSYTGTDGKDYLSNSVKRFLPPQNPTSARLATPKVTAPQQVPAASRTQAPQTGLPEAGDF